MKNNAENNEETVTLTKKQLDALVGTINEVCNLAAEEMDSMRLLKGECARIDECYLPTEVCLKKTAQLHFPILV